MIIDPEVEAIATGFAEGSAFTELIQAVVTAEGNILKAVQCSIPSITSRHDAIRVVCRSAIHAMADFIRGEHVYLLGEEGKVGDQFIKFWELRWAPPRVSNDPTHLNQNWAPNVIKLWDV